MRAFPSTSEHVVMLSQLRDIRIVIQTCPAVLLLDRKYDKTEKDFSSTSWAWNYYSWLKLSRQEFPFKEFKEFHD